MKKNLFEIGADFGDNWSSDNKTKTNKTESIEIKTPQKHRLHFAKEKRNGKIVTIVSPFYLEKSVLETLLANLKKSIGTGGTIKKECLEFQGEQTNALRVALDQLGYGFKK